MTATAMTRLIPVAVLLLAGPVAGARAQDAAGRHGTADTELTLTGAGAVHAAPDRLTATLFAESNGATPAAVQGRVNSVIRQAVDAANAAGGLTIVTDSYVVQHDEAARPAQWTARQVIRLTGADGTALLTLVGQLQARGLGLSGLDWSLSPERRSALTQQAEAEALRDVRRRAEAAAKVLGMTMGPIRTIALQDQGTSRPMPMMMTAARASMPPTAPLEEQTVTAAATATIMLRP
ncbi:SIMPL domain-containing protein [Nguyenibacter sp. L1]|uniref:SIMPL domain-containing protein n=1 Tax=Nguyenibacter sp. L1 TaxID=3049350 RepID=UPI002B47C3CE|nr:SIMPL domain-containing protein [Nguyenibacter sp. L1]WRH86384.1 SIMPL domain-containing protein [Nguyenibacter sp. L1]